MNFNLISLFPDMFKTLSEQGLVGQAIKSGKVSLNLINPRQFTSDVHKTVDDRPYGGGDGMVMLGEPLRSALDDLKAKKQLGRVILMSPQGRQWTDKEARAWAALPERNITLISARYGGVDQRFINSYVDDEISIGDFVLTGGELAAMVIVDSVARFIPGVLGNAASAEAESFSDGLLEAPLFTRPTEFEGQCVPEVLRSGHHVKIEAWRMALSLIVTLKKRPDLLSQGQKTAARALIDNLEEGELAACGISRSDLEKSLL
jgi:tRNA (guanine37-N1)-methyltransferase